MSGPNKTKPGPICLGQISRIRCMNDVISFQFTMSEIEDLEVSFRTRIFSEVRIGEDYNLDEGCIHLR